jgi:hypothetical protein
VVPESLTLLKFPPQKKNKYIFVTPFGANSGIKSPTRPNYDILDFV